MPSHSPSLKIQIMGGRGVKAKHCWVLSTNFLFSKVCWQQPAMFAFISQRNFSPNILNVHWRWKWWDPIPAIFLDIFYFSKLLMLHNIERGREALVFIPTLSIHFWPPKFNGGGAKYQTGPPLTKASRAE